MFFTLESYSQSGFIIASNKLNGIWIAEKFANSFDSTKSIIQSKDIFDPQKIVGIVFNIKDTLNNLLYGSYSTLNSHITIQEKLKKTSKIDSLNPFSITFYYKANKDTFDLSVSSLFCDTAISYKLQIINDSMMSVIEKTSSDDLQSSTVYKKISSTFSEDYSNPEAIYYYTRLRTLAGNYVLYDSANKILSNNFEMSLDGKMRGYKPFDDLFYGFSTDVYCAPTVLPDLVVFYDFKNHDEQLLEWAHYVHRFCYYRLDDNTIQFLEYNGMGYESSKKRVLYILKRK